MFGRLFRTDPMKEPARAAYEAILTASRRPFLYEEFGAPDTVDGRFDLLVMHAVIFFRHVRHAGEAGVRMNQLVFDRLFDEKDVALREMGASDPGVGKKIKQMGQAFYGRAKAYEAALNDRNEDTVCNVIRKNLFAFDGAFGDESPDASSGDDASGAASRRLAGYMLDADACMAGQDAVALIGGQTPRFPGKAR